VLGTDQGSAQLSLRLDEAHLHVDSLISKGVHRGTHVTLVLVGSHYGGVDFKVIGQGHALGRPEGDILAIESVAALGTEGLASRVSVASIHRSFILLGYWILSWIARALWTDGL
jgi:hypothetical protein